MANAAAVNVDLKDFGYPPTLRELCDVTKNIAAKDDNKLKRLFLALKEKSAPDIIRLIKWVQHLKSNPYAADLEYLKSL